MTSCDAPPQRTACSPNRSVSDPSVKVVLIAPARCRRCPWRRTARARTPCPWRPARRRRDRHALAFDELTTNEVAQALRCNHGDIDVRRRLDVAEADVEAVA